MCRNSFSESSHFSPSFLLGFVGAQKNFFLLLFLIKCPSNVMHLFFFCISIQICGIKNSLFLIGICTASTPFVLLGDVLDCLPLDQCDKIFTFVEKNVATWKSVGIFAQCCIVWPKLLSTKPILMNRI